MQQDIPLLEEAETEDTGAFKYKLHKRLRDKFKLKIMKHRTVLKFLKILFVLSETQMLQAKGFRAGWWVQQSNIKHWNRNNCNGFDDLH